MFILICHTKVSKLGTWLEEGEEKKVVGGLGKQK
jgi:hypothetical protein